MKKTLYTILLSLICLQAFGQWNNLPAGTWQRTADGFKYRTAFGASGTAYWYTVAQIDSLLGLKQKTVALTTTGSSGAATFNPSTGALNIPVYGSGIGTVSSFSFTNANGVNGTVTNPTTTPNLTLSLGAITPTSTNGVSAATMVFNDATSSIQTQLNGKQATLGFTPENVANKTATASSSPTTYPNWLGITNALGGYVPMSPNYKSPVLVGTTFGPVPGTSFNGAHTTFFNNGYVYVVNTTHGSFTTIDVSNPSAPVWLNEVLGPVPGTSLFGAVDMDIQGRYAYVVCQNNGDNFTVIDLNDPANPVWLSSTQGTTPGTSLKQCRGVKVSGRYAYVTVDTRNSIAVIDVSNPAAPVQVAELLGGFSELNKGMYINGKYLYVTDDGNNSLYTIDISNPLAPTVVNQYQGPTPGTSLNRAHYVQISGKYAYVASQANTSISVIDISVPTSPAWVSQLVDATNFDNINEFAISNNYLYAVSPSLTTTGFFTVVNIANPTSLSVVNSLSLQFAKNLSIAGNYAYVTTGSSTGSLNVVDVSQVNINQANIGNLYTRVFQAEEAAHFDNTVSIKLGLNVGDNIFSNGSVTGLNLQSYSFGGGKALFSNGALVAESTTTGTELGYVSGVTSPIQTQLNTKLTGNAVSSSCTNCNLTYVNGQITVASNGSGGGGTTTNPVTFNSGGAGASSPITFDGSVARTISYNTIGASPLAGSTSLTTVGTLVAGSIPYSLITGGPSTLTFTSPGNTLTGSNVTNDLMTGKSGGLVIAGGTTTDNLTIKPFLGATSANSYVIDVNGLNYGGGTSVANTGFLTSATYLNPSAGMTDFFSSSTFAATGTASSRKLVGFQLGGKIGATNNQNLTNASGALIGINGSLQISSGATGIISNVVGSTFSIANLASGATVTNIFPYQFQSLTATGAVTNLAVFNSAAQTAATNNTYMLMGTSTVPTGNWLFYGSSSFNNYFGTGNSGFGTTSATATVHIKAGTATAGTAPLKFTSGTNLTTTEAGAVEYDGSHLYFTATNAGTRFQLDQQTGAVSSVSNADGSLTISPTTGAVVASLNTGHSNNFTVPQTFSNNITMSGTTINIGSHSTTSGGLLYGDGVGNLVQASFARYNSQGNGYLGAGDADNGPNIAQTVSFNSSTHLGAQLPYMTAAQRLALNTVISTTGTNTATLAFQTNSRVGLWELKSANDTTKWRKILDEDDAPQILATVTGINAKSTGTTALYTVPVGRTAVVTGVYVRCTAASAITAGPSADVGVTAADIYANSAMTALTTSGKVYQYSVGGVFSSSSAANTINLNINTAAVGTSQSLTVTVIGYLQ